MRALIALLVLLIFAGSADAGPIRLRIKAQGSAPPPPTCDITLTSSATMNTTLNSSANSGKTICLDAAGSPYGRMAPSFNHPVMTYIKSVDPLNPVTVQGVECTNANNVTVSDFIIVTDLTRISQSFRLNNCANTTVTNNEIRTVTAGTHQYAGGQVVSGGPGIVIRNNRFHDLNVGFTASRVNGILVQGNDYRDIHNGDAMQFERSSNVTIDANTITDLFFVIPTTHADVVQFLATNTLSDPDAGRNITITNTFYSKGAGSEAQGLFLGNETGDVYTGNLAGTTLTLTATIMPCRSPTVGDLVSGTGVAAPTYIVAIVTPPTCSGTTFSSGAYTVDQSQNVSSTSIGIVARPYVNVTIAGNQLYGSQNNGIACAGCAGFNIDSNVVRAYLTYPSAIVWNGGYGGNVSNNLATGFIQIVAPSTGTFQQTTGSNLTPCSGCTTP